jgi:hypothetical protein
MTINTYSDIIPQPPPVTTGTTIQSYTDPNGDVWVAKNGVNGGAWKRARDVLHCSWYRNAAFTYSTSNALFTFDAAVTDVYGLYVSGTFTAPVPGIWLLHGQLGAVSTAVNQSVQLWLQGPSGTPSFCTNYSQASQAGSILRALVANMVKLAASDTLIAQSGCSAALACQTAQQNTFFSASYMGTG